MSLVTATIRAGKREAVNVSVPNTNMSFSEIYLHQTVIVLAQ